MICQNNIVGKIIRTRDRPKQTRDRPKQTHDRPKQTRDRPKQTHDRPKQTRNGPKRTPSLSGLFGKDFLNSLDLVDCGGFLWVGILEI